MLRDLRPEISRSVKSAAQDPRRDAGRHGSGALLRIEGRHSQEVRGFVEVLHALDCIPPSLEESLHA
jgi:hypothetical protein